MRIFVVVLFLFALGSAGAQAPTPKVPCSEADLRRSMAETAASAAELKAETRALRVEELERENAKLGESLGSVRGALTTEQRKAATLAESLEGAKVQVSAKESELATATAERESLTAQLKSAIAERDKLAQKIRRANRRWNCRIVHLGCIGER